MSKQKKQLNKTIPINFRVNKNEEEKLIKIQEKLQTRTYSATIRELIRRTRV